MEKQDVPKEKKAIKSITNLFGAALKILYAFAIAFSFITAIALSYECGLVGWAIIGYKLMMIYLIIGAIYCVLAISKTFSHKLNEKNNERRIYFKEELKKEILKELKHGNTKTR